MSKSLNSKNGFTLIEILIVLAIVAMMAALVIVAINPARQFAQARNTQRWTHVNAILNAAHQNMIDNNGNFDFSDCPATSIPSTATNIGSVAPNLDFCGCLVPDYLGALPVDPTIGAPEGGATDCAAAYDTGYTISQNATTGRITVAAPEALNETPIETISVTR